MFGDIIGMMGKLKKLLHIAIRKSFFICYNHLIFPKVFHAFPECSRDG